MSCWSVQCTQTSLWMRPFLHSSMNTQYSLYTSQSPARLTHRCQLCIYPGTKIHPPPKHTYLFTHAHPSIPPCTYIHPPTHIHPSTTHTSIHPYIHIHPPMHAFVFTVPLSIQSPKCLLNYCTHIYAFNFIHIPHLSIQSQMNTHLIISLSLSISQQKITPTHIVYPSLYPFFASHCP